ncbi:MAG: hypothetical protein JRE28_01155 [Deltaproteobacteria bacterium]|nr:hypothetical protein [Deltaproteobacteria bacterium]
MKKRLYRGIIMGMMVLFTLIAFPRSVFAWGPSAHAYVAKMSLALEDEYVANYNARMGSIVPDFFWYLKDLGLIDDETAYKLHGVTEEPDVVPATTYFYDIAFGNLKPWIYRLKHFTEGIRTHVYADIKAHNTSNGYVEGTDMWCDFFLEQKAAVDREALHLAIEFSVDSLLVHKYGLQLGDILFSYRQSVFMEKSVEAAFDDIGVTPDFDVSLEFKKYLALMRVLEKTAKIYAPYLIKGAVDEALLNKLESRELLDAERELSDDSLDLYSDVLMILLIYPQEIHETITTKGMHWENDALPDIIDFCRPK